MLTEKDYCDYDTCVALREVGCRIQTQWYIHQPSYERGFCYLCFGIPRETSVLDECDYIPRLSLYEAQKWLRDEKQMLVIPLIFADNLIDEDGKIVDRWKYYSFAIYSTSTAEFIRNYDQGEECDSYEEALLEGVKSAIKILKEEK